jgi:aminopeptidase N
VLRVAAVGGDRALYDRYQAQLATLAAQPEQYYRIFGALAWFNDPALVRRTLEFALSSSVRTQDTGTLIGGLLARPESQEIAWQFVRDNWSTIVKSLGEFQGIPQIVESWGAFCSAPRAKEIRDFFAKNPVASSQRAAQQAVERIENCVALRERQERPMMAWLGTRSSNSTRQ